MDKVWPCKCLTSFDKELREKFKIYIPMNEVKECPACHAKPAEKPKTLTEKIENLYKEKCVISRECLVQTCYEHVNEIAEKAVEEIDIPIGPNHDMELGAIVIFKIELLRRLKDSL